MARHRQVRRPETVDKVNVPLRPLTKGPQSIEDTGICVVAVLQLRQKMSRPCLFHLREKARDLYSRHVEEMWLGYRGPISAYHIDHKTRFFCTFGDREHAAIGFKRRIGHMMQHPQGLSGPSTPPLIPTQIARRVSGPTRLPGGDVLPQLPFSPLVGPRARRRCRRAHACLAPYHRVRGGGGVMVDDDGVGSTPTLPPV